MTESTIATINAWRRHKDILTKGSLNQSVNESVTEVFIEQPLALPGSAKY